MALLYLFIGLLAQGALISCQEETQIVAAPAVSESEPIAATVVEETVKPDQGQVASSNGSTDLFDILLGTEGNFVPASSAAAMEQITSADKSPEQKVEDVKVMTQQIMGAVKKEMEDLLHFAMASASNVTNNETARRKRSTDSPMDSTSLLMKLLGHMKNNNEHQNIALDNMMTAQEIADKYGIKYNPDVDLLSNLISAAAEKVQEIANIVNNELKPEPIEIELVPLDEEPKTNDDYYVYTVQPEVDHVHINQVHSPRRHHHHFAPAVAPDTRVPPVSYRRNVFESDNFTPIASPCPIEVAPVERPVVEPELNAEEQEETISSRLFIEKGEQPGSAAVRRVMTHTISEKGYFKTPKIERLPQQVRYSFYLE